MENFKKILKEFSVFAIVIVCFLGLFVYRLAIKADISTISETKLVHKIESKEDFVVFTASGTSNYTSAYKEVVETYLTKNRSEKIYFLDLDNIEDADTFVSTYLGEEVADLVNPNTYAIVDGQIIDSESGAVGYYALSKLMETYNVTK